MIRGIKGVEVCFLMTEWVRGIVRISFRSTGKRDVNKIARELEGGGHAKAAGTTLNGTIVDTIPRVLSVIEKHLK